MDALGMMFEHNEWATRRLLEHCDRLEAAQLDLSLAGTFGAIAPTLVHIVAEDQRYLARITGEEAPEPVTEADRISPGDLVKILDINASRWSQVLQQLPHLDVTLPARDPWPAVPHAESLIMLEAIQHGNDHRTHVITVLSHHGLDIPILDGWHFWQDRVLTSERTA